MKTTRTMADKDIAVLMILISLAAVALALINF